MSIYSIYFFYVLYVLYVLYISYTYNVVYVYLWYIIYVYLWIYFNHCFGHRQAAFAVRRLFRRWLGQWKLWRLQSLVLSQVAARFAFSRFVPLNIWHFYDTFDTFECILHITLLLERPLGILLGRFRFTLPPIGLEKLFGFAWPT